MKSNRPNVLFILSDQHNAKLSGYAGHAAVKTPALDRLAAEGVAFTNAFCNNTICTPSRMSFLSGQYCHNHGYYGLSGPHPGGLPSLLSHFRRNGYRTGAIGKMHCPDYWLEDHSDVFVEAANSSIGGSPEYERYLRAHNLLHARDDRRYPEHPAMSLDARPSNLPYEHSVDAWIARQGVEFMSVKESADRPFFLHLSFPHPHQVYAPSQEFWDLYPESKIELPPNADWSLDRKAPHLRRMAKMYATGEWTLFEPLTDAAGKIRKLRGYYGVISQVDHAIGGVIDWMRKSGLLGETIVVYSSDHGEFACEHGIVEKAPGICSDAVTRIPMIWRLPSGLNHLPEPSSASSPKAAPVIRSDLFESIDLSATLCDLCGVDPMATSDGHSHAALFKGERPLNDRTANERFSLTEAPWSKAITDGRFRLVRYPRELFRAEYPDGFGELYDLKHDPWEMNNLFFDPEHAVVRERLREALLDTLLTTTRPVTVLPGYGAHETSSGTIRRSGNSTAEDGKVPTAELRERARSVGWHQNYL